jgi:hypothetical protein
MHASDDLSHCWSARHPAVPFDMDKARLFFPGPSLRVSEQLTTFSGHQTITTTSQVSTSPTVLLTSAGRLALLAVLLCCCCRHCKVQLTLLAGIGANGGKQNQIHVMLANTDLPGITASSEFTLAAAEVGLLGFQDLYTFSHHLLHNLPRRLDPLNGSCYLSH